MKSRMLFAPLIIGLLSACNGGSGHNPPNDAEGSVPEYVRIDASPMQSKAMLGQENKVNVSAENDANVAMKLTSVRSISDGTCQVISTDGMSFTTTSDHVGECQFEYTVIPVNGEAYSGEASSFARVSVSQTANDNVLPNLSETTDIDTPVIIDLSQQLKDDIDTSVFMLSEDLSVLGAGIVDTDTYNNTLTFTPFEIGVSRVTYSMTDGVTTMLGTVDIAVSDSQNTPPVASNYMLESILDKDMLVTIDLTASIYDAEDAVILESVRAYNAETAITSASDHTFTFRSSEPGNHEVAYTINDGRGGYDVGQVLIEVEADFSVIQDWQDITTYDDDIQGNVTFTAPMSKTMADYVNEDYVNVNVEDGSRGPNNAQIVQMNWHQAASYCEHRGGRLPMTRELNLLVDEQPFTDHNWPTASAFWSVDKVSQDDTVLMDLYSGTAQSGNTMEAVGYATCVYMKGNVKSFTVEAVENDDLGEARNTTRRVSAILLDPDGNPAPYQEVLFSSQKELGGFGIRNDAYQTTATSNSDGHASTYYEFTRGYHDDIFAQYGGSADFTHVTMEVSGFDATNPDDWSISKILGDTPLENYEPIVSNKGTMISIGEHDQYITSISRNNFLSDFYDIQFTVDRTDATKTNAGAVNVVLQQVSSKAPDVNSWCDEHIYGSCNWANADSVGSAGIPVGDERWLKVAFGYYNDNITVVMNDGNIASGTQPVSSNKVVHYRILGEKDRLRVFYRLNPNDGWTRSINVYLPYSPIDPDQFYYLGFSGGASSSSANGVIAYIKDLTIDDDPALD
ncbi:Ig-like domain-containing protein [Vibrio harveyi]|uniref:Lipoprotein n=1 Tax=Vibrio harveyi TaxID=669 RepID=A0A8B3E675_VIBHA|nr:hypothetical protein [Vibrio harveyi]RIW05310.1 hypothetical protein DS957_022835 [Vibrio harveyi]